MRNLRVGPKRRRRPRLHRERSPDGGGGRGSRVFIGSRQKRVYHHHLEHHYLEKFKKGGEKVFELSKAVVNELPDPAVYNHPPGVEQLVTRPVVEQLVRGRHYHRFGCWHEFVVEVQVISKQIGPGTLNIGTA